MKIRPCDHDPSSPRSEGSAREELRPARHHQTPVNSDRRGKAYTPLTRRRSPGSEHGSPRRKVSLLTRASCLRRSTARSETEGSFSEKSGTGSGLRPDSETSVTPTSPLNPRETAIAGLGTAKCRRQRSYTMDKAWTRCKPQPNNRVKIIACAHLAGCGQMHVTPFYGPNWTRTYLLKPDENRNPRAGRSRFRQFTPAGID